MGNEAMAIKVMWTSAVDDVPDEGNGPPKRSC